MHTVEVLIFGCGKFQNCQVNHENFLLQPTIRQMALYDTNLKIHCCPCH